MKSKVPLWAECLLFVFVVLMPAFGWGGWVRSLQWEFARIVLALCGALMLAANWLAWSVCCEALEQTKERKPDA